MSYINSRVLKILSLAAVLVLMLALCGCRTRITNNDEVTNVMYDEEGYLSEEYQMRRDELSLSKAEKPLFTGFGTPDDDYYDEYDFGDDADAFEDYDPESYRDDYEDEAEPEQSEAQPQTGQSTTGTGSRTTTGTGNRVVTRRPTTTRPSTSTTTSYITVSLNGNGGKSSPSSIRVKTGSKYSSLSSAKATREGYTFKGWNTKKDGTGSSVTSSTKVTSKSSHTLYAQWEETVTPKNIYTVTFDPNGGELTSGSASVDVEEGTSIGSTPTAVRTGYLFEGWFSGAEDGDKIKEGAAVNDNQTWYAHWKEDPDYYFTYWNEELSGAVKQITDEEINEKYQLYNSSDKADDFLGGAGMVKSEDEEYTYIVFFGTMDEAQAIEVPEGKRIIVVPKEAIKSTINKEGKLLYQIKVYNLLYPGFSEDLDKAAEELGVTDAGDVGFADEAVPGE